MTKTQEKNTDRAKEQGQLQLESIRDMVKRLKHCQECEGGEDCTLSDEEIYAGINLFYKEGNKATEEEREQYHDEDEARQQISEGPLSAEIVKTYEICLCTGGPAVRIIGKLDEHGQPKTARLQYQDWFTPWVDADINSTDEEMLLDYAREFYFEE